MEQAIALMLEQGAGRDAAVLQNNLAVARIPLEGPARALAAFEQAIAFCEQRGLTEMAMAITSNRPELLVALGRTHQALEQAAQLAAVADSGGDGFSLCVLRTVELTIRLAQGDTDDATSRADWLLTAARELANTEMTVVALTAVAATRAASGRPDQARDLLTELDQTAGAHENANYPWQLPVMVRTALAAGDPTLAHTLTDRLQPHFPLHQHALTTSRAQLAEHAGNHSQAATLYADAAERWREFRNVPERAHALLGQARCLIALGQAGAEQPLNEARDLFASMGYKPALARTEQLLATVSAAASS
jgi:tetratricopeptide (TPR) repeat protein